MENYIKWLKEKIERIPRMALLGPKSLSRAFFAFQGSCRFMIGFTDSQGSRPTMEDEIVILGMGPRMRPNEDYFAIFDGHGGHEASEYVAKNLHEILDFNLSSYPGYLTGNLSDEEIKAAFKTTFREVDESMCVQYGMQAGSCALVAYFSGNRLFMANLGDSRAVLGTKQGPVAVTKDHKPSQNEEYKRIISNPGGFVSNENPARVQGQLSVSRAFGDSHLKPFVSSDPDIFCKYLTNDLYFLILGCDGVWDKITDEEAVSWTFKTKNPQEAATNILKKLKGRSDNISIVVIFLCPPQQWEIPTPISTDKKHSQGEVK